MSEEECKKLFKEGDKFSSFLKREYYAAAISYIRAAECFLRKKVFKRAYDAALRAIECLERTRGVTVSDEFERAFEVAFQAAKALGNEEFNSVRERFFSFLVDYASSLEMSEDFISAAEKYMKVAEIVDESRRKEFLVKAAECFEKAAEIKVKANKKDAAVKLLQRGRELLLEAGDGISVRRIDQKLQKLGVISVTPRGSLTPKIGEEVYKGMEKIREEIVKKVEKAIDELKKTVMRVEGPLEKPLVVEGEPTLFEKIRKKGKFFDKLSYVILEILRDECPKRGGIITLSDIVLLVNKGRKENPLSSDIIFTAVEILEKNGLIPKVETLHSGIKIIPFIELSSDHREVLNIASEKGWTTIEEVIMKTGWSKEKALLVLRNMEESGLAISQTSVDKGTKWFFPALYKKPM